MALELEHGEVQDIESLNKNGEARCRINNRHIKLHRDLSDSIKPGDDVWVAGATGKNMFHALALKKSGEDKVYGIDCTNYILLLGAGFILFIMFGVFGLQESGDHILLKYLDELVSTVGLVVAIYFVRYSYRVTSAVNRIRYANNTQIIGEEVLIPFS